MMFSNCVKNGVFLYMMIFNQEKYNQKENFKNVYL